MLKEIIKIIKRCGSKKSTKRTEYVVYSLVQKKRNQIIKYLVFTGGFFNLNIFGYY